LKRGKKNHIEEVVSKCNEEEKLAKEIERLRKEGSKQLEEEQELIRKQLRDEMLGKNSEQRSQDSESKGRIKVKWNKKGSISYSKEVLEKVFLKYGNVTGIVINEQKGGSAIVELDTITAAKMALNIETGFPENPLKLKQLWEERNNVPVAGLGHSSDKSNIVNTDFESLVMRKLRQEEERKRLIQQMMEEDS